MIYLTPFDEQTKKATAPSTNSGFPSFDAAVACLGAGYLVRGERSITYPGGVFLSDYVIRTEPVAGL